MNIYVSRDGQTFGPYTPDQAREFLQAGQLLATDFALYEGETEWKTLSSLFDDADQPIPEPVVEHSPAQVHPSQAQPSATSQVASKKKRVGTKKGAKVKMNKGPICCRYERKRIGLSDYFNDYCLWCNLRCGLWSSCRSLLCFYE